MNGKLFSQEVGCYDGEEWDAELVELCLRGKTSDQLFQAYTTGTFRSRGSVDGFSEFPPVLPDLPDNLLQSELFHKVLAHIVDKHRKDLFRFPSWLALIVERESLTRESTFYTRIFLMKNMQMAVIGMKIRDLFTFLTGMVEFFFKGKILTHLT